MRMTATRASRSARRAARKMRTREPNRALGRIAVRIGSWCRCPDNTRAKASVLWPRVMRIAVIATGVGNVRSVVRALDRAVVGPKDIAVTAHPDAVRRADAVVVPGQGSFGAFSQAVSTGLDEVLRERIRS